MLNLDLPFARFHSFGSLAVAAAAAVVIGGSVAHAAAPTYSSANVTNISAAVTAAGASTIASDFASASVSSDGKYVAGLTSTNRPYLYSLGSGTATVLSSVTGTTIAVNTSGTLVSGNNTSTSPNVIYNSGTSTTVPYSAISNPVPGYSSGFVSLSGINNSGTTSGYVQYGPSGSGYNEGAVYSPTTGTGRDVGSGFSNVAAQARGNVLYSINDSGVAAGYGAASPANSTQVFYTATPTAGGGYTYNNLSPALNALSPTSTYGVTQAFVGIDSNGDVAGSFSPSGTVSRFSFRFNRQQGIRHHR